MREKGRREGGTEEEEMGRGSDKGRKGRKEGVK